VTEKTFISVKTGKPIGAKAAEETNRVEVVGMGTDKTKSGTKYTVAVKNAGNTGVYAQEVSAKTFDRIRNIGDSVLLDKSLAIVATEDPDGSLEDESTAIGKGPKHFPKNR